MEKEKKCFSIEVLLYMLLVISPFLDSFSFLLKQLFPNINLSITAIIRPILPVIVMLYIFFCDKKYKTFIIGGILYGIYALGHLVCFNYIHTESAYGNIFHEAQYIFNYTYMMLVFYLFYYFITKNKLKDWYRYVRYFLIGYISLLYIAILTGTSSSTYITGIGYKGWNASGNAVGSILLLSSCLLLPSIVVDKKKTDYILLSLVGFYLMFLLGTRVGLLGFPLILLMYLVCSFIFREKKKKTIINKKNLFVTTLVIIFVALIATMAFNLSATLKRQQHLESESNEVIDKDTNMESHITGDALKFVKQIKSNEIDEKFMNNAQQKALIKLYDAANKMNLSNQNRRVQQFLYHSFLVIEQNNPILWLFGNGYLSNYSEMTLEMEFVALLYNFGIVGFILYVGVFLVIDFLAIKTFIKKRGKVDVAYSFYLFSCLFAVLLSFFAGYTFFHVSCMLIIILLHLMLNEKRKEYEK